MQRQENCLQVVCTLAFPRDLGALWIDRGCKIISLWDLPSRLIFLGDVSNNDSSNNLGMHLQHVSTFHETSNVILSESKSTTSIKLQTKYFGKVFVLKKNLFKLDQKYLFIVRFSLLVSSGNLNWCVVLRDALVLRCHHPIIYKPK